MNHNGFSFQQIYTTGASVTFEECDCVSVMFLRMCWLSRTCICNYTPNNIAEKTDSQGDFEKKQTFMHSTAGTSAAPAPSDISPLNGHHQLLLL